MGLRLHALGESYTHTHTYGCERAHTLAHVAYTLYRWFITLLLLLKRDDPLIFEKKKTHRSYYDHHLVRSPRRESTYTTHASLLLRGPGLPTFHRESGRIRLRENPSIIRRESGSDRLAWRVRGHVVSPTATTGSFTHHKYSHVVSIFLWRGGEGFT